MTSSLKFQLDTVKYIHVYDIDEIVPVFWPWFGAEFLIIERQTEQ